MGRKFFVALILLFFFSLGIVVQNVVGAGLSRLPLDLKNISHESRDREILTYGVMAEVDSVNLYEQMAAHADSDRVKGILLDMAKQEKAHVSKIRSVILALEKEQIAQKEAGENKK